MKFDKIDDTLSGEQNIVPSSGFVSSVMNALREEALAPPPIPFPWRRGLPGLAALLLVLGLVGWEASKLPRRASPTAGIPTRIAESLSSMLDALQMGSALWITLALLLTLACLKFSMYLAKRGA